MRSRLLAVIASLFVITSGAQAQQQFRLFATIVDAKGAPAAGLVPGDVKVMENGVEAKVLKVEPVAWPLKVQLLVDNGVGLGNENLSHLRNGVRGLLDALPEGTEVTFVSTAPQPRFLVRATTDRAMLLGGLDRLAPDSGAGRFVDSLNEATQRIEKDKTDYFPVIISAATTSGDNNVMERDIERIMKRLGDRPTPVYVVLLTSGRSASGGGNQTNIGINVAEYTRGKFESINAPSRLATLLPEIGATVARSHPKEGGKFLVTAERPGGAAGDLGKVSLGTRTGLSPTEITLDSRK